MQRESLLNSSGRDVKANHCSIYIVLFFTDVFLLPIFLYWCNNTLRHAFTIPSHSLLLNKYKFYSFFFFTAVLCPIRLFETINRAARRPISQQGHIQAITWFYGQHPTSLLSNWIIKQRGNNLQATESPMLSLDGAGFGLLLFGSLAE